MTIKEFIISRVQIFFFLVTLILTATVVLGAIYQPDKELRYYHLLSPVILAACCVLPTCVTYFKKEPTPAQFIIRQIIELALIEAVVMFAVVLCCTWRGNCCHICSNYGDDVAAKGSAIKKAH